MSNGRGGLPVLLIAAFGSRISAWWALPCAINSSLLIGVQLDLAKPLSMLRMWPAMVAPGSTTQSKLGRFRLVALKCSHLSQRPLKRYNSALLKASVQE